MTSLRRSLLFVPGDDERKIQRAFAARADTLLFDLEDAVAPARKAGARATVAAALQAVPPGIERAVRINPAGTAFHDDDLAAMVAAGADVVLLPKCDDPDVLDAVAAAVDRLAPARDVRLLALLESARGVLVTGGAWAGCRWLDALCFGHVDLALDLGLPAAAPDRGVLLHARCQVVLAARAAGVAAIDSAFVDFRDDAGCRADARLGRELGFGGKLCIHPSQVPIVNAAFTPDASEVARAREIVAAWDAAERRDAGVVAVAGTMVDAPVVALQRAVLARAAAAAKVDQRPTAPTGSESAIRRRSQP